MIRKLMLAGAIALVGPVIAPLDAKAEVARYAAPPGYTELRVAPPPGGTVYIYEGHRLLGRFDQRGSMLVPTGRALRVVATRGDTQIWAGEVNAAGALLDLDWARDARFRQPFPPPRALESPTPPIGARAPALSTPSLRSILRAMDDAADDRERLDAVTDATVRVALSGAQASALLGRFRSDAYRLAALDRMRDKILDRDDVDLVLERFRNPNARRFAEDLLGD